MSNLKKLYYYFGRDESRSYIATPMQSALICGGAKSGKRTLLNSLLVWLIQECSPNILDIRLHCLAGNNVDKWCTPNESGRAIPHITQIRRYGEDQPCDLDVLFNDLVDLVHVAEHRVAMCDALNEENYVPIMSREESTDKFILCIVDEFQVCGDERINKPFNDVVHRLVELSARSCVYVMLIGSTVDGILSSETVEAFRLKACTPTDEKTSNMLLRNNCAYMDDRRWGVVWVKDSDKLPSRFYVPFHPDTWFTKFIGYFSIRRASVDPTKFE